MSVEHLTLDNPPLSRPNKEGLAHFHEINVTGGVSKAVAEYVRESLSWNTQRSYISDLAHFEAWGGPIPASSQMIAEYLVAHAGVLSVATLRRRLAALAKAHRARGSTNPTSEEVVKATLRGLKRVKGTAQHQAKALARQDLFVVLGAIGVSIKDTRDLALLIVGFAGGFRRSELIGLDVADLEFVRQGLVINIQRSKTDQNGKGRKIGIPQGRGKWCPVSLLRKWLSASGISAGPVFRPVDRHGRIGPGRLSGEAVCLVLKSRLSDVGFDPRPYSGHSLRAGFATSAAQQGVSSWKIRQQTGHASDAGLARYIRDGEMFLENAAGALF
jgi:integrase